MTATLGTTHRTRDAVRAALLDALDRLDGCIRPVAAYHLGFTALDGQPPGSPASSGGKALRPILAMLSTQAAGAPDEVGLPGAVAVELVHNFSLVHDDLMDGDRTRRHRPTVWAAWDPATAILLGDAFLALAQEIVCETGNPHAARASALLAE